MPTNSNRGYERLKYAVDELSALNQIANAINVSMSVEEITRIIVDNCIKRTGSSQGAIFLLDEEDEKGDRFKTFIREISPTDGGIPFHLNISLTGWMIKNKGMLLCNNPSNDDRLKGVDFSEVGINSVLAGPLLSRQNLIGLLVLFNKKDSDGFSENDKRFISIVGTQTSKVIENAQLYEKEKRLLAIEEEMKVAKAIQEGFLPRQNLSSPTCEICGFSTPAREMGGDYYDMVQLDDHRIFVSLGDVSGKGIPAALLMANAQAVLRSQLFSTETIPLTRLARSLNHMIYQFTGPDQFITAFFGIFNCDDKSFRYINAGHEPPVIIRRDGKIERISESDLVIGVLPEYKYTEHQLTIDSQEILYVFTDGVTEAFNDKNEQYGNERLDKMLKLCAGQDSQTIGSKVMTALSYFRGSQPQADDITMLILKVR